MKEIVAQILVEKCQSDYIKIADQSHLHHNHFQGKKESGTHLAVEIKSALFNDLSKVKSHQLIYSFLKDYMNNPIHALQLTVIPTETDS